MKILFGSIMAAYGISGLHGALNGRTFNARSGVVVATSGSDEALMEEVAAADPKIATLGAVAQQAARADSNPALVMVAIPTADVGSPRVVVIANSAETSPARTTLQSETAPAGARLAPTINADGQITAWNPTAMTGAKLDAIEVELTARIAPVAPSFNVQRLASLVEDAIAAAGVTGVEARVTVDQDGNNVVIYFNDAGGFDTALADVANPLAVFEQTLPTAATGTPSEFLE